MKFKFIKLLMILLFYGKINSTELIPFDKLGVLYISENNVPLYKEPDENSEEILNVNILDFVYLIERRIVTNSCGKLEEWCFVDTSKKTNFDVKTPTIKGWMLGGYLIGKRHFKPVKRMKEMFIIALYPDDSDYYRIYSDGTFIQYKYPYDKKDRGLKGRIYRYKNIIAFKFYDSLDFYEFFYYDKTGNLGARFADLEVITNKKEFPF